MTYKELMLSLDEIRAEFCPTSPEQKQAAIDQGYYSVCGCVICSMQEALIISEVNNGAGITDTLQPPAKRGTIEE